MKKIIFIRKRSGIMRINRLVNTVIKKLSGSGLEQELAGGTNGGKIANEKIIPLARLAAAEGIVMLKNNNNTLPLKKSDRVAVFGRCAINYFGVGYGSGGDIIRPYLKNLIDGLRDAGVNINNDLYNTYLQWINNPKNEVFDGFWGHWPMNYPEMPLNSEIVNKAAKESDIALVVIGRAAGEDRENTLTKGSYYLTESELNMLSLITAAFDRVAVIMDCGNIIDMSWEKDFGNKTGAILYAWQGGMESGNALADVLTGKISPSGKLTDTIASSYSKYPGADNFGKAKFNNYTEDIYVGYRYFETFAKNDVIYPFGYGLSYTDFDCKSKADIEGTAVTVKTSVKNTGKYSGKEVVQVYLSLPQGTLGNPSKVLAAFSKTKELAPDEEQTLHIRFNIADFAPYDDSGKSGKKSAYILEKGNYRIFAGTSVRDVTEIAVYTQSETVVINQLSEHSAVQEKNAFKRIVNKNGRAEYEKTPVSSTDLKKQILDNLPKEIAFTGDKGIKLSDVKGGKNTMEEFVAQLSPQELDDISHGEGQMNSSLGIIGNAGAFGGITPSLRDKGIPPVITCDGPSGIRIKKTCALLPCGTALASSFNCELVENLYAELGEEMVCHGVNVLLAPGMNIHRNPLCGRNFEYFSEDPFLTGKIAAAVVNGIQSKGVSACPKHFACNNQEKSRNFNDSRLSERALREIYLKGFELMVKDGRPHTIMTSYNKVNGVYSHYNYELVTAILRGEWNYDGLIITDWWMSKDKSPEFPKLRNDAYRVRAQVDVLMPGGDGYRPSAKVGKTLLETYRRPDGITLGEMQRTAVNVLNHALKHLK